MPATPKRQNRTAREGARFPSQIVADNVRAYRGLRGLSQAELSTEMNALGHGWSRQALSEIERAGRHVNVEELFGLALVLEVTPADLLDGSALGREMWSVDVGAGEVVTAPLAQLWVRDRATVRLEGGALTWEPQQPRLRPASEALLRAWEHRDEPVEVNPPEKPTRPKQPTKKGHR